MIEWMDWWKDGLINEWRLTFSVQADFAINEGLANETLVVFQAPVILVGGLKLLPKLQVAKCPYFHFAILYSDVSFFF